MPRRSGEEKFMLLEGKTGLIIGVANKHSIAWAIAQSAAYLREQKGVSIEEYQKNFLELLLKDERR